MKAQILLEIYLCGLEPMEPDLPPASQPREGGLHDGTGLGRDRENESLPIDSLGGVPQVVRGSR